MARTETTQTPAIMAVLPAISANAERGMTSSTTRIVMAASARMVTLASIAGQAAVVADFGGRFLRFEVHGRRYYAGSAGGCQGSAATVKRVAFGAVFAVRGVRQCTAYLSSLALICCLLFNDTRVRTIRDHAVFRTAGSAAQIHPLAGGRLRCRHAAGRTWSSTWSSCSASAPIRPRSGVMSPRWWSGSPSIAFGTMLIASWHRSSQMRAGGRRGGARAGRRAGKRQRWRPQATAPHEHRRGDGHRGAHPQTADLRAARRARHQRVRGGQLAR